MANTSDTNGFVQIEAENMNVMMAITKAIVGESNSYQEYGTVLESDYESEDDFEEKDGKIVFTSSFFGSGRWSYINNIEKLFVWAINEPEPDCLTEEEIKLLEGSEFKIKFDFKDYEPGNDFYYEAVEKMFHHKGEPLLETEWCQTYYADLDNSWEARLVEGLESEEDLEQMLLASEPSYVYSFLEREKEGLENYYGETLEELFKDDLHNGVWKEIGSLYHKGQKEVAA